MHKIKIVIILLSLTVMFHSCVDDDKPVEDNFNTKVSFISPSIDQMFEFGDTVFIKAEITSDISVHGYEIFLNSMIANEKVSIFSKHTHGTIIWVDKYWIVDTKQKTANEVEIKVAIDHIDNFLSASRSIICN